MKSLRDLFVQNLKALRANKGLTQEQMAEKCRISLGGYQKFEYGVRSPKLETLEIFARALGKQPQDLIAHGSEIEMSDLIADLSEKIERLQEKLASDRNINRDTIDDEIIAAISRAGPRELMLIRSFLGLRQSASANRKKIQND